MSAYARKSTKTLARTKPKGKINESVCDNYATSIFALTYFPGRWELKGLRVKGDRNDDGPTIMGTHTQKRFTITNEKS